jgi:succinoglycan biosynthesis protein ExoA
MPSEVSIIIPCFNEQATIGLVLDALEAQTYPHDRMEVVITDGGSTDGTLATIQTWAAGHRDIPIRVIQKPASTIPSALNAAIKASTGEIILRMDAHSKPHPEYVERSINALTEGRGQNVGGIWEIQPGGESWIARSIASAAAHPIGVGGARYRYADQPAHVDTVPFGAFHRRLLDQVGMFDETLLTNEDYEFNARIRQSGGRVWLDPQIRSVYYARRTLRALSRQYWRYGYWKWQMLRRYPETVRFRQALPPLFILGTAILALLAAFLPIALWVFLAVVGFYTLVLFLVGMQLAIKKKALPFLIGVPLAIATMHFTWGAGFLWSVLRPPKLKTG